MESLTEDDKEQLYSLDPRLLQDDSISETLKILKAEFEVTKGIVEALKDPYELVPEKI